MKRLRTAIAFAAFAAAATSAFAGEARPVVVELFTSQGCSSCPPADALMGKLAARKDVIGMSLPITYWDMLGWKDTLAIEADTRRQKAYAAAMNHGGVYTPQIIVDGTKDVVGSRAAAVEVAIESELEALDDGSIDGALPETVSFGASPHAAQDAPLTVPVVLTRTPGKVNVAIGRGSVRKPKSAATVWLFRVRSSATVRIGGGENKGRTMTYRNVVSDIKDMGRWHGEPLTIDLPRTDGKSAPPHDTIVVLVQQSGYGHVIGAASLAQAQFYAQQ
jgi:hypothetical protein